MEQITKLMSSFMPAGFENMDFVGMITGKLMSMIPENLLQLYFANQVLCNLALICILMLVAAEGYKLFKLFLYAGGAFLFAYLGYYSIVPILPESVIKLIPGIINPIVAVCVICGIAALLITKFARSLMIMIIGGAVGYYIGTTVAYKMLVDYFHTLNFLKNDTAKMIIGGVIAVICGLFFIILFKHLFILLTAVGGSVAAAYLLYPMLITQANGSIETGFIVAGVVLGIVCVVYQYKEDSKDSEIYLY